MAKAAISRSVRNAVMARDNWICRACGFGGSPNFHFALDCDHVTAESDGGKADLENLQCLCKGCNLAKKTCEWRFDPRTETVAESVWAVNQKIVNVAFTVGIKEGSVAKTLKRLR